MEKREEVDNPPSPSPPPLSDLKRSLKERKDTVEGKGEGTGERNTERETQRRTHRDGDGGRKGEGEGRKRGREVWWFPRRGVLAVIITKKTIKKRWKIKPKFEREKWNWGCWTLLCSFVTWAIVDAICFLGAVGKF